MKTAITANVKDSIGAMAIIACIFASAVASIASSQHANVNAAPATIYKLDVIEVTAPRMKTERMATIVVTASRTENTMVASNSSTSAAF